MQLVSSFNPAYLLHMTQGMSKKFPEGNTPEFQKRLSVEGGIAAVLFSSNAFLYFQVFHNKNALLLQLDKNER